MKDGDVAETVVFNLTHQHHWTDARIRRLASLPGDRPLITAVSPESGNREWIVPVRLEENWSLRGWKEVFEALRVDEAAAAAGKDEDVVKRVYMGMVGGDSSVIYYIVHEGLVKPRQN